MTEYLDQLGITRANVMAELRDARRTDAGTGSRWELQGYLDILDDAIARMKRHRRRSEGIDRQIALERSASARTEGA